MERVIPLYAEKEGTVRVSGSTLPRKAGRCAFYYLQRGLPVEFFCIGANANQQAMKAMGIFRELVDECPDFTGNSVAFQPLRVRTHTVDPTNGDQKDKDAVVWRTLMVTATKV